MPAPTRHRGRCRFGGSFRAPGLTDRIGKRFQIIRPRFGLREFTLGPQDVPPLWRRQAGGVIGAQIIGMRLGAPRKRADHSGAVGIGERECRHGGMRASGSGAAASIGHGPEPSRPAGPGASGAPIHFAQRAVCAGPSTLPVGRARQGLATRTLDAP